MRFIWLLTHLVLLLLSVFIHLLLLFYWPKYEKETLALIASGSNYIYDYYEYLKGYFTIETEDNEVNVKNKVVREIVNIEQIRQHHPDQVLYYVGQVAIQTDHGYVGIIVGWTTDQKDVGDEPMYEMLITEKNSPRIIRVNQSSLSVLQNVKIILTDMDKYFEEFDGSQYIPKPWLRVYYPHG